MTTTTTKRSSDTTGDELLCRRGRLLAGLLVGWRCPVCGQRITSGASKRSGIQMDHLVPHALGGGVEGNLVPLCGACNASKSDAANIGDWLVSRLVAIKEYKTKGKHCQNAALRIYHELIARRDQLTTSLVSEGIW